MTLNCYKFEFSWNFLAISYIWKATTAKRMEIDPYCQRQNCSQLNVPFIDVWNSLILLGVRPLGVTITLHRVARVCQRQLGFLVMVNYQVLVHEQYDQISLILIDVCERYWP